MAYNKSNLKHLELIIVLILLILFSITSILYLDIFPKVWMDEGWDSTTAYTFQKDGTFRNLTLESASRGNQDVHFLQPRILSNIFMTPFYALLGIGSVQGRLASVFMGALAVIGLYFLSRKIGGIVFASVCVIFFIFDNLFFVVTRTIRPEIYVVTIAIWALFLILNAGTDFWKLFFGGVLLGISLYAHPNAFLVLIAVLIIALSQVNRKQYGKILLPMVLGIAIGFLPYALYVGYQDGANHFHDFWLQIHDRAGVLTNTKNFLSGALATELERYTSYIFFPYRLAIFLIQIVAIGYAFYKKGDMFNHSFLIFIFVQVLLFPILISANTSRYLTVLMPVVIILVIKMVWGMAKWSYDITLPDIITSVTERHLTTLIPIALGLILFINQIGGDFWAVWQSRDCSFSPFITQVRNLVPSGKKVWGAMTYWFGFYDYPYRTEWTINNYEEMSKFQPDYVILYDNSEIWGNKSGVTKRFEPNYVMEPVRNLLSQLVKERGVFVGSVPNSCYGDVEIYKLRWK
jgi:4-amino-4-deoxy-L-arabinose transferase-like glycosyltransferase